MLKNKSLKTFLRASLLSCLLAGVSVQPLFAKKVLSSGIVLPGRPVGFGGKLTRLGILALFGGCVGGCVPFAKATQTPFSQSIAFGAKIGVLAGSVVGLAVWNTGSAQKCIDLFNSLYNSFLLNPVLERDITLATLISRSVMSDVQSYWVLVRVADVLDEVIQDLAEVLTFGQMLRESTLIQGLGDAEFESLVSKISSLRSLLGRARARRDSVLNHPSYRLQKEFYKRYGALKLQRQNSPDVFELLWNDWCVEQLAHGRGVEDTPTIYSLVADMSECSLCGLMVSQSKRYVTKCACSPGRHFYHHECVSRALKHNKNECLRCGHPAVVHSAFSSAAEEGPVYGPPAQDSVAQNRPHSRYRCTLCRGAILRNKAYKCACACPADTYFYHHDCLKTHLGAANNCPVCHAAEPTVLSDFNDGFVPARDQSAVGVRPSTVVVPTAPLVDESNTCALCSGKIMDHKRYKTRCDCRSGRYYYHHLCIADTLKKSENKCPKCSHENTTVHSAF